MPWRKRLGERGGQGHDLDAETRSDGFDPVAEQPRQTLHIAHGLRRSDPDRLDTVVHPVKQQIETPCAEAFGFERVAELHDELSRIAGDGFRGADRLGEAAANLDEVGRAHRIDRLGDPPQGLIETPSEFRAKAQRQRCTGFCRQLADAFEAKDAKAFHHLSGQAEGGDGQVENRRRGFARRNDDRRSR